MKERILKEMSRYDFEREVSSMLYSYRVWSDTYTYSMLKSSHITKGKDFSLAHHLDTRDEILLAFQNGMSEKDSVLFTEKAISIAQSNWFSKNVVEKISWTDIKKIELINHSLIFTLEGEIEKVFNIDEIFSKNLKKYRLKKGRMNIEELETFPDWTVSEINTKSVINIIFKG